MILSASFDVQTRAGGAQNVLPVRIHNELYGYDWARLADLVSLC